MSRPRFRTHNDTVFDVLSPFIVAPRASLATFEWAPFGVATRWHVDPFVAANETFFRMLQRLDQLTFGPEGMPMARWVFYECAELPGAIYGFAIEAAAMTASERGLLRVPTGYAGPVPVSMYIAIPMPQVDGGPRTCFGHNLASLNRLLPGRALRHLGSLTKVFGLAALRVERSLGATQWSSAALFIHTKFGPLELMTAWTPSHSIAATLTYAVAIDEEALRAAAGDDRARVERPSPARFIASDDVAAQQSLQAELEAGTRWVMCGPARLDGGRRFYPLAPISDREKV